MSDGPPNRQQEPAPGHGADAGSDLARRRQAWADFRLGLGVTVVLIVVKILFEHGEFGRQIELMTLNLQQLRLGWTERAGVVPVVVDITPLPFVPRAPGDPHIVTDRVALRAVVEKVAALRPAAIGLDVLLDPPNPGDALTRDEIALLEYCLALPNTFVGIFDGVVRGPTSWLGEPRFGNLAAVLLVPRPAELPVTTSLIRDVTVPVGNYTIRVPSMAVALARAKTDKDVQQHWLGRMLARARDVLLEHERERELEGFHSVEFPINFGSLARLRATTIVASRRPDGEIELEVPVGAAPRGNIVLIGRAETGKTADTFTVPGQAEPVAGVYVHAAAAHTLVGAPLYRPTHVGRIVADLFAALVPLGFVLWVRLSRRRPMGDPAADDRFANRLMIGTAVAVFVLGYFWIAISGILWTDYLMVVVALLLHRPFERLVHGGLHLFRRMTAESSHT